MKTLSSFKTLSTKKARNFLAKDGPGSFDQPGYNIPIFRQKVNTDRQKKRKVENLLSSLRMAGKNQYNASKKWILSK